VNGWFHSQIIDAGQAWQRIGGAAGMRGWGSRRRRVMPRRMHPAGTAPFIPNGPVVPANPT